MTQEQWEVNDSLRSLYNRIDTLRINAKSKERHPATRPDHAKHYKTEAATFQLVLDLIEKEIRNGH